jgi:hypothetical protein
MHGTTQEQEQSLIEDTNDHNRIVCWKHHQQHQDQPRPTKTNQDQPTNQQEEPCGFLTVFGF